MEKKPRKRAGKQNIGPDTLRECAAELSGLSKDLKSLFEIMSDDSIKEIEVMNLPAFGLGVEKIEAFADACRKKIKAAIRENKNKAHGAGKVKRAN
jgi:hypothetical protein